MLDVAVTLFSAERPRRLGHEDCARKLVAEAVEDLPGRPVLLEFERRNLMVPLPLINWRELLLPYITPSNT